MLQDMIRAPTAKPMEILLRQASPDTYKDVLREVKAKEYYNLVIDTKPENMNFFLKGVSVQYAIHDVFLCPILYCGKSGTNGWQCILDDRIHNKIFQHSFWALLRRLLVVSGPLGSRRRDRERHSFSYTRLIDYDNEV